MNIPTDPIPPRVEDVLNFLLQILAAGPVPGVPGQTTDPGQLEARRQLGADLVANILELQAWGESIPDIVQFLTRISNMLAGTLAAQTSGPDLLQLVLTGSNEAQKHFNKGIDIGARLRIKPFEENPPT